MQSSLPLWSFEHSGPITLCACLDALSHRVVPHGSSSIYTCIYRLIENVKTKECY